MILYYIFGAIIGLSLGSLLNALEWRIKNGISLLEARSKCVHCGTQIAAYDNIPVLSFVLLRGACRACKKSISWQYPIVEMAMALLAVLVVYVHGSDIALIARDMFTAWVLLFIFIYDMKYMEVLDVLTLGSAAILFVANLLLGQLLWYDMLIGAGIAGGFFLLQYVVSKGTWIGGGDIRIGILMGIILGWKLTLLALWLAYVGGAIVAVVLLLAKKKKRLDEIAFGTYLAVASFVALMWGSGLFDWYMSLFM